MFAMLVSYTQLRVAGTDSGFVNVVGNKLLLLLLRLLHFLNFFSELQLVNVGVVIVVRMEKLG